MVLIMANENKIVGATPVTIVEIYQDQVCQNDYGVSPCLANKPAGQECYKTKKTCQDNTHFNGTKTIVWRFTKANSTPVDYFEIDGDETKTFAIPSLVSTTTSPSIINVAGAGQNTSALGKRATLSAVFQDMPYNDQFADPYVITRTYNPLNQGTFWGKFLARNPYYQNSRVVVYDGYLGMALADMQKREYLIDKINIASSGVVTVTAKDPLRLADDKRSLAPSASDLRLYEDSLAGSTTIRVNGNQSDLGATGISTLRYMNIKDEIISYTGYSTTSDFYQLSNVIRGEFGTESEDLQTEDKAQRLLRYEDAEFQDVVNDLLVNHTPLDNTGNQFWNLNSPYSGSWKEEYDEYLSGFTFTGTITKPTSVNKILANLCQQGNFYIWWNDRAAQIEFKTVRPSNAIPTLLDDDINLMEGVTVKTKPEDRYSRAVIYYGQRNPLLNVDDTLNYQGVYIRVDADSEQDSEYGESRTKNIYADFLSDDSFTTTLGTTFVQRFRDNPQFMSITVDAKDGSLWTGDIVDINTRNVQNPDGSDATGRWQIVSAQETISGEVISYMLQNFVFVGRFGSWMANDALDYLDTSLDNRASGMWWSDVDGNMSNGDEGYKWQ